MFWLLNQSLVETDQNEAVCDENKSKYLLKDSEKHIFIPYRQIFVLVLIINSFNLVVSQKATLNIFMMKYYS